MLEIQVYTRGDEIRTRRKILDTLRRNNIENIKEHVWPSRISTDNIDTLPELQKYKEFKEWAKNNNIELKPYFKQQTKNKKDKKYTEIILPVASIAIYLNNKIQYVFPSNKNGIKYNINDFLTGLKQKKLTSKLQNNIDIKNLITETSVLAKTKN